MTTIPTPGQLAWQQAAFGLFLHFGINTFHSKEWSDGSLDPATFDPTELDTAQWVDTAVAAGAQYVVLTAKHHDGFCLWPTKTTGYSVASSPWRDGHGDVVGELAEACRAAGLGLGLYLPRGTATPAATRTRPRTTTSTCSSSPSCAPATDRWSSCGSTAPAPRAELTPGIRSWR
ncbi:alpha-L-fucosidase [Streptomyces sp. bgisy031]|uniref:alpha-L-fucosidase n=1 Tax=Streptomyces sp. bgisy031 TaxID=3413772 RepID=UPI003D7147BB